jgi:hypothetical protein
MQIFRFIVIFGVNRTSAIDRGDRGTDHPARLSSL